MCVYVNAQARARTESEESCAHKWNLFCGSCKSWPTGSGGSRDQNHRHPHGQGLPSGDSYLAKFWTKLNLHADCISKKSRCISSCKRKYMLCMDLSQSFPASGSFPMSQLFASGSQSIGGSASASVLPMNIQDWLVGSPCSPRDSQESPPTLRFKTINSSALSFLYSPTLISLHDYWKNQSFD